MIGRQFYRYYRLHNWSIIMACFKYIYNSAIKRKRVSAKSWFDLYKVATLPYYICQGLLSELTIYDHCMLQYSLITVSGSRVGYLLILKHHCTGSCYCLATNVYSFILGHFFQISLSGNECVLVFLLGWVEPELWTPQTISDAWSSQSGATNVYSCILGHFFRVISLSGNECVLVYSLGGLSPSFEPH